MSICIIATSFALPMLNAGCSGPYATSEAPSERALWSAGLTGWANGQDLPLQTSLVSQQYQDVSVDNIRRNDCASLSCDWDDASNACSCDARNRQQAVDCCEAADCDWDNIENACDCSRRNQQQTIEDCENDQCDWDNVNKQCDCSLRDQQQAIEDCENDDCDWDDVTQQCSCALRNREQSIEDCENAGCWWDNTVEQCSCDLRRQLLWFCRDGRFHERRFGYEVFRDWDHDACHGSRFLPGFERWELGRCGEGHRRRHHRYDR
jgi:hypothetical protein